MILISSAKFLKVPRVVQPGMQERMHKAVINNAWSSIAQRELETEIFIPGGRLITVRVFPVSLPVQQMETPVMKAALKWIVFHFGERWLLVTRENYTMVRQAASLIVYLL